LSNHPYDINVAPARDYTSIPSYCRDFIHAVAASSGPTGRYLVDQKDKPFLIASESPQTMMVDVSEKGAELFFANRRSRYHWRYEPHLARAGGMLSCAAGPNNH
jgi:hypothetical protein